MLLFPKKYGSRRLMLQESKCQKRDAFPAAKIRKGVSEPTKRLATQSTAYALRKRK